MPEIDALRFLFCSNYNTYVCRYGFFGMENEDIQFSSSGFLDNGMIYRKIIGNKGYRLIPLKPSVKFVPGLQLYPT